jgi:hypothetical protein
LFAAGAAAGACCGCALLLPPLHAVITAARPIATRPHRLLLIMDTAVLLADGRRKTSQEVQAENRESWSTHDYLLISWSPELR